MVGGSVSEGFTDLPAVQQCSALSISRLSDNHCRVERSPLFVGGGWSMARAVGLTLILNESCGTSLVRL